MELKWEKRMELGIPSIDSQHKNLVEMCSKAFEWAKDLEDGIDYYDQINEMLSEIIDYTQYHFSYEEELMNKYDFDRKTEHEFEHKFFVKKLNKLSNKDYDEPEEQKEFVNNLSQFLFDWLVHHIMDTDKKYVNFLKEYDVS
ncbi:MAG: bacteriohemerythrin [Eubacteriales bacterium]